MAKFNWQLSSIEDMATQIVKCEAGVLRQQVNYYKCASNVVMLEKIAQAKKLAKLWELEDAAIVLRLELGLING